MSSLPRIRSSQANGALSTGPTTEAGKRKAALANLRHGLLSKCAVIENESKELFDTVLQDHLRHFAPRTRVERGIIEDIACAYWRLRRVLAIETTMFNVGLQDEPSPDQLLRLEHTFAGLSATPKFNVLNRYETRLQRTYQRALRNLAAVRERPLAPRKSKKQKIAIDPTLENPYDQKTPVDTPESQPYTQPIPGESNQ